MGASGPDLTLKILDSALSLSMMVSTQESVQTVYAFRVIWTAAVSLLVSDT